MGFRNGEGFKGGLAFGELRIAAVTAAELETGAELAVEVVR
jgi:hypothetical protein